MNIDDEVGLAFAILRKKAMALKFLEPSPPMRAVDFDNRRPRGQALLPDNVLDRPLTVILRRLRFHSQRYFRLGWRLRSQLDQCAGATKIYPQWPAGVFVNFVDEGKEVGGRHGPQIDDGDRIPLTTAPASKIAADIRFVISRHAPSVTRKIVCLVSAGGMASVHSGVCSVLARTTDERSFPTVIESPPSALRIAVLTHTAALGGAEIALLRLARNLDPARYQVHFIVFAEGALVDELRSLRHSVEVVALDAAVATAERHSVGRLSLAAPRHAAATAAHARLLARRLRQLKVQVVHANSLKSGVIGAAAARLAHVPLVWYVHDRISGDYLPPRTAAAVRLAVRYLPARVITNSLATLATLGALRPHRATVAYPGLEAGAFSTAVRPRPAAPLFGLVGRISPTKGQAVFLKAAAEVARRCSDARFLIVGAALFNEREYEAEVRRLATAPDLDGRVRFTGHVPDVAAQLRELSAVVHASPVPEPFGQVVIEAMAAGVPVIATAAGGVNEILDGGPDGMLGLGVDPGDERGLAAAMVQVLEDPESAESRATRALASVRRRFTIDQTAQAVMACWEGAAR